VEELGKGALAGDGEAAAGQRSASAMVALPHSLAAGCGGMIRITGLFFFSSLVKCLTGVGKLGLLLSCVCAKLWQFLHVTRWVYALLRATKLAQAHDPCSIYSRVPQTARIECLVNAFSSYRVWGTSLPSRRPQINIFAKIIFKFKYNKNKTTKQM
jgi:hypothetical protein